MIHLLGLLFLVMHFAIMWLMELPKYRYLLWLNCSACAMAAVIQAAGLQEWPWWLRVIWCSGFVWMSISAASHAIRAYEFD